MASIPSDLIQICRGLINDIDSSNYVYTDDEIKDIIIVAAFFVTQEVDLQTDYTIDIGQQDIDPSPSSDVDFLALTALKTACILLEGEYKEYSIKSISFKDGPSSIDMRGAANHKKEIAENMCGRYKDAVLNYNAGKRNIGTSIVGPYTFSGESVSSGAFFR